MRGCKMILASFLFLMLSFSVQAYAFAAAGLLPIPNWLPTEPGAKLSYRFTETRQGGAETHLVSAEVREVTHSATAYVMSMRVFGGEEQKLDIDLVFAYKPNVLTISCFGGRLVVENVRAENNGGDELQISMPTQENEIDFKAKVFATGTKVAIDEARWTDSVIVTGVAESHWGAPFVVEGKERERRIIRAEFKATLSSPEGLIRASSAWPGGAIAVELVPARRPFEK